LFPSLLTQELTVADHMRSGCDLMHLFFMFDEYSDQSTPDEVWRQAEIQMDAFCYPDKPRPRGEWVGGEIARQYVNSSAPIIYVAPGACHMID
jgi:hypothetical protein